MSGFSIAIIVFLVVLGLLVLGCAVMVVIDAWMRAKGKIE
jgi:hypothetical protein